MTEPEACIYPECGPTCRKDCPPAPGNGSGLLRKFEDLPVCPQRKMSADELAIARELVTLERRRVAAIEATADAATMDAHTRALALVGAAGLAAIVAVLLWRMSQE